MNIVEFPDRGGHPDYGTSGGTVSTMEFPDRGGHPHQRKPVLVYLDARAEVHVGDTVRYVDYNWRTRGKFYRKTGTVTELWGSSGIDIHFPHHAKGTNLSTQADHVRLVKCVHGKDQP